MALLTFQSDNVSVAENVFYPVGAIYMSTVDTNPNTLFGFGTWELIVDKFLLLAGDTYIAGSEGGEAEHTLTVDEIPNHRHTFERHNTANGGGSGSQSIVGSSTTFDSTDMNDKSTAEGGTVIPSDTSEGYCLPHNNIPQYLAVNIWKRVA